MCAKYETDISTLCKKEEKIFSQNKQNGFFD